VKLSEFSRWAEPLNDSVPRVLAENLSILISTDQVFVYPWSNRTAVDFQVELDFIRFEGQIGEQVSLRARWRLLGPKGAEITAPRAFQYSDPGPGNSTQTLVAAMSRALGALSTDIAAGVANVSTP
jgi:hypothetical protein